MKKIQYCAILSVQKNIAQIGKTLHRPFSARVYIHTYAKSDKRKPTAFKSPLPEVYLKCAKFVLDLKFLGCLFKN